VPIPEFVVALREKIGHDLLWTPGVTAVVVRDGHLLMVQRSDNQAWTPVTGVLDPGEEPAVGALREVLEETGVTARVERLASVSADNWITHVNGDQAVYLDLTFVCSWVSGEPYAADDESLDARWVPLDALPPMRPQLEARVAAALSEEVAARFEVSPQEHS
jgi:8-oxo-dGTP pyrophosphatase MutT (NUDIX family)